MVYECDVEMQYAFGVEECGVGEVVFKNQPIGFQPADLHIDQS